MSDSLLDLFNSPPSSRPPHPPRSRSPSLSPTRSPRREASPPQPALFLSPGSATDTPRRRTRAASFEPDDEPARSAVPQKRAAISFENELGAEKEESAGRYVLNDGLGDPLDPFVALHAGNQAGDGKKKRVLPKIDGDRLMGPNGFPALIKAAKRFKARGKGHETQDLKDLMNMYQIWAHNMFPKGDFKGTIMRVEKVCKTRRLESALKGYRDAFYPPPPEPARSRSGTPDQRGISPVGDSPASQPDATQGEPLGHINANGDDPDMDDILAMEEMERHETQAASRPAIVQDGPPDLQEEDEWEGLYN